MPMKYNPYSGTLDMVMGPGSGTASIEFDTDSGAANPTAAGVITIAGGTGISTSGSGSTVTVTLDTPVTVSHGGTGRSTLTDGAILVGDGTNAVEEVGPLTDGQLLIGNTGGVSPTAATLTAGTGISISNGAGSITISATTAGSNWTEVTGTSQSIAVDNSYVSNNASLVTFTLPASADLGDRFRIVGKGAGLYKIEQNAGQTIYFAGSSTTTGTGGSLTAVEQYAAIEIVCITANNDFAVLDSTGNFTVV